MKLHCDVQLHDRDLCTSTQWQRSVLSLEKKVDSYKISAYLIWETEEKDQIKYLISTKNLYHFINNIQNTSHSSTLLQKIHNNSISLIFKSPRNKFINIRSTDGACLARFIIYLEYLSFGWWYIFYEATKIFNLTLTYTQIVRNKREYPPTEGFPSTTEKLTLRKLDITELDVQSILNLHSLKVLNLSNNQISFLPKELGTLPHLEELVLSHNCLGNTCSEIAKWEWMEQSAISQSLKELNISNNNLTELPLQIGKLQSLICLNVSNNLLRKVPQIIGTLQQLAWLDVSANLLSYLPESMRGMELFKLCAINNPFRNRGIDDYKSRTLKVVSLLDLSAKAVKKYRIPYNNLPSKLARYLDNSKYCCICRNPCFHSDIKNFNQLLNRLLYSDDKNLNVCQNNDSILKMHTNLLLDRPPYLSFENLNVCQNIQRILAWLTNSQILFKCYFCSSKCYGYYCKTFHCQIITIDSFIESFWK